MASHLLFESASGYAVFEVKQHEEIGAKTKAVQDSIGDLAKFGKMVQLLSFSPFKNAAHALENANDVSEGVLNEHLKSLLELVLSKAADDLMKAQLGLGHSYSRAKVKFNVNRMDNMIIQAIALLDQLDKDVNLFAMRVREWYGYHFPELVKLIPDNYQYARAILFIGEKEKLTEGHLPDLAALLEDDTTCAQNVLDAARGSMGASLSEIDMLNISAFATRVVSLADYRKSLTGYLAEKMNLVAPSLTALLGERIGARLISHAGSLTNLSKYPASTVQILGAEKALFRALKTKGNTPKYGLIYHSTFIGRAGPKHKGRISRFLANKTSIASRIDCFSDNPTAKFGDALRSQVEERLAFFETGAAPSKNADAMRKVLDALGDDDDDSEAEIIDALPLIESPPSKKEKKKEKKEKKEGKEGKEGKVKKRKADAMDVDDDETVVEQTTKRVKLSKEEKKALKNAKKEEAKKKAKGKGENREKSKEKKKKSKPADSD
ncbi:hypothetical protein EW145_g5150 [Phellinidium pouzarii]|uniref:Nucleolar protein 56 n=1 Tax=Phellinidium pouzarii TaxID=167371 RepID=A0A4S4L1H9_9AGAM|nr:hypothetical protein EW145_g5150 [Phellinidium pouzarii]